MGYIKLITYGQHAELYQYEENLKFNGRGGRKAQSTACLQGMGEARADSLQQGEQRIAKRTDNARRTSLLFRRLVSANLGVTSKPLLISLTYAKNLTEIRQGYKDFKAFARLLYTRYGKRVSYIAVPEFQKRGAIHFHALIWGLPTKELAETERRTRLVAGLWGHGFIDLIETDGDIKISSYLAKYMTKAFLDPRLKNQKSYTTSRNIKRPVTIKNPLLLPLFTGGLIYETDLSTAVLLQEKQYMTKWLGKGRYRRYQLIHT